MKKLSTILVCLLIVGFAHQADAASCTKTTKPYIKVLSPNGGEFFTAGQQVPVKWESCNVKGKISITPEWPSSFNTNFPVAIPMVNNTGSSSYYFSPSVFYTPNGLLYGESYKIIISDYDTGKITDSSDKEFTIFQCATTSKGELGSYTLSNSKTPEGANFNPQHAAINNFHFATISLTTSKKSAPVCINQIQLGSSSDPSLKIGDTYIYDKNNKLLATVPITDWGKNGSSWYAWTPYLDLNLNKGGTAVDFVIKADVLDSKSMTNGLFNLGISGMHFGSPGARGYPMSFGNIFAVN